MVSHHSTGFLQRLMGSYTRTHRSYLCSYALDNMWLCVTKQCHDMWSPSPFHSGTPLHWHVNTIYW